MAILRVILGAFCCKLGDQTSACFFLVSWVCCYEVGGRSVNADDYWFSVREIK